MASEVPSSSDVLRFLILELLSLKGEIPPTFSPTPLEIHPRPSALCSLDVFLPSGVLHPSNKSFLSFYHTRFWGWSSEQGTRNGLLHGSQGLVGEVDTHAASFTTVSVVCAGMGVAHAAVTAQGGPNTLWRWEDI